MQIIWLRNRSRVAKYGVPGCATEVPCMFGRSATIPQVHLVCAGRRVQKGGCMATSKQIDGEQGVSGCTPGHVAADGCHEAAAGRRQSAATQGTTVEL